MRFAQRLRAPGDEARGRVSDTIQGFSVWSASNIDPSRSTNYRRPPRLSLPWWFWSMFGERGVFLFGRAGKGGRFRGQPGGREREAS